MSEEYMQLRLHGGMCCGIKHIEGFDTPPKQNQPALNVNGYVYGASGQQKHPGEEFFRGEAPQESSEDRLDRYLDFLRKNTPGCLVDICLTSWQTAYWDKELTKRGFKVVAKFTNSNTTANIVVYHLILEGGE